MAKNILIVVSGKEKESEIIKRVMQEDAAKVFLSPLDYEAVGKAESLSVSIREKSSVWCEVINFVSFFNKKCFELKEGYLKFIYETGEKEFINGSNLKQYFKYPGSNFSLWWFSLIAEKNPYKSDAFTVFSKSISLLHLKKEYNCEEVWVGKESRAIYEVFSSIKENGVILLSKKRRNYQGFMELKLKSIEILRVCRFILELAKKLFDAKKMSGRFKDDKKRIFNCNMAIVTMFPFLDEDELRKGRFVNLAYGILQEGIESCYKKEIAWLGMYSPIGSSKWPDALRLAGKLKKTQIFYLLEEWASFKDLWNIILTYARVSLKALKTMHRYREHFIYRDSFTGLRINLAVVFRKDFISSFFGKVLIQGITNYAIFFNIVNSFSQKATVIYFAEMHAWEKALDIACEQREEVVSVGIQHTIVPLLLLNYFNHPDDLRGSDYEKYFPLPDYLGCVGGITKRLFIENGWPREKVFISGAFRFQGIADNKVISVTRENKITVAFSISPIENQEILDLLYRAFNDKALDLVIELKSHPCAPIKNILRKKRIYLNEKIFRLSEEPLPELVARSKAMIVKESSSLFWALHNKIPVLVPNLYNTVDLCPLSHINNLAIYVDTPDDLFRITMEIMHDKIKVDYGDYKRCLDDYLEFYSDDKAYYKNLVSQVLESNLS